MYQEEWIMKSRDNLFFAYSQPSLDPKHYEELMKSQDHVVWELNGGCIDEEITKEPCETLWEILNSRAVNAIVVVFTVIEGLILLAELLIDLRILQDPYWVPNVTQLSAKNETKDEQHRSTDDLHSPSPNLQVASQCFAWISLSILSLFLLEVMLRIMSGKVRFFKQCMELLDAMVVFAAFALALAFLSTPRDGRNFAVFIVILRLWRIKRIVHSVIHNTKRQMSHIINAYKRDKIQAEHKVELLILKVEDLEHEVAYLKEKLKKTDKEAAQKKKRRLDSSSPLEDDFPSLPHVERYNPLFHNHLPLQRPPPEGRNESPPRDQELEGLQRFAESTVKAILRTASNELVSKEEWQQHQRSRPRLRHPVQQDDDNDDGDENGGDDEEDDAHVEMSRACMEDTAVDTNSIQRPRAASSPADMHTARKDAVRASDLLGDNTIHFRVTEQPQEELDELSEIERVKKIQYDPTKEEDVPVTAL